MSHGQHTIDNYYSVCMYHFGILVFLHLNVWYGSSHVQELTDRYRIVACCVECVLTRFVDDRLPYTCTFMISILPTYQPTVI